MEFLPTFFIFIIIFIFTSQKCATPQPLPLRGPWFLIQILL